MQNGKEGNVTEHKRMANYELLRVLAMIMVVVMHFLAQSDSLLEIDVPVSGVRVLGSLRSEEHTSELQSQR